MEDRTAPPRGKRELPIGLKVVRRLISLPPTADERLRTLSQGLRGGRSEWIRRQVEINSRGITLFAPVGSKVIRQP
jgi:hypothetical protein